MNGKGRETNACDVFISYSRNNKDDVLPIKDELERLGVTCWVDLSGIPCGVESFKKIVIPGIKQTRVAFLFFLSVESQASEYAVKEINFAKKRAGKRVILIRFNDDEMNDEFFFDYQDADVIDWRVPEQKEKLLRDLMSWREQVNHNQPCCPNENNDPERGVLTEPVHPGGSRRSSGLVFAVYNWLAEHRRVVYVIFALLALAVGAVYAGVTLYNESRVKDSVVEIRVESMALKEKIDRISKENGFGQKIEAVCDEFRKAEAFYAVGKWHESSEVFTNYIQRSRELVDLDCERQAAEWVKGQAEKTRQQAASLNALTYAAEDWSLAVQTWQKADDEFSRMEFTAARDSFEKSARRFEKCAVAAESEKKRLEKEYEEQRRIAEQKRREAESLAAERRAEEERRKDETRRKDAEKLTKLRTAIKVKVRDAKGGMESIADFRADPVGFKKHLDNADEKWKYVEVVEMNPVAVTEAEAVLKLVEESESVIANEVKWLKANKGARDEARSIEAEIAREIDPELERVDAGKYAKETFLTGKRLRDDGNSALAKGDLLVAKKHLLAAQKKLSEAIAEAKSPWSSDMWQHMKEDVLSVRLEYEKKSGIWSDNSILVAYVPQRGLDSGEVQLTLDLMRGSNVVEQIQNITLSHDKVNPDYRRAEMKCRARRTKGIDAYVLHVTYKSLPVDLRYIPTVGVNIEEGTFYHDVTPLAMAGVYFMGECRELLEPIPQFQGDVSLVAISNYLNRVVRFDGRKLLWALGACGALLEAYATKDCVNSNEVVMAFRLLPSVTEVRTNGLLHVQARARDYYVAYTNEMPVKCRIDMDAKFFNPCGAQIFAVRDKKKLGAWGGGESILYMPRDLQGCELPSYVILRWNKD